MVIPAGGDSTKNYQRDCIDPLSSRRTDLTDEEDEASFRTVWQFEFQFDVIERKRGVFNGRLIFFFFLFGSE